MTVRELEVVVVIAGIICIAAWAYFVSNRTLAYLGCVAIGGGGFGLLGYPRSHDGNEAVVYFIIFLMGGTGAYLLSRMLRQRRQEKANVDPSAGKEPLTHR